MEVNIRNNPRLFDFVIQQIEMGLSEKLLWLNSVFGKCEKLKHRQNGREYILPNWYHGGQQYTQVLPCSDLGNLVFFVLNDPQDIEAQSGQLTKYTTDFSVIFWYDTRTIDTERNTERIKEDIIKALNGITLTMGRVTYNTIWEDAENVLKGFDMSVIENQYLMAPYSGLRIDGKLTTFEICENDN